MTPNPQTAEPLSLECPTAQRRPHPLLSRLLAPPCHFNPNHLSRAVKDTTILITGASFGIGRSLAVQLGRTGAQLILAARNFDRLSALATEIRAGGGHAVAYAVDLRDPAAIDVFLADLEQQNLIVDIVVHNAGKSIRRLITQSLDRCHDFRRTMAVNYLGPVQLQLALLPGMLRRGRGHIVSVSTLAVRLPPAPRWAAYTASKGAFDIWMHSAGTELKRSGIACTSVYLGLVHTGMSAPTKGYERMPGQTPDEAAAVICRALITRPRTIAPWWLGPLRLLAPWWEGPIHWLQSRLLLRDDDKTATRKSAQ